MANSGHTLKWMVFEFFCPNDLLAAPNQALKSTPFDKIQGHLGQRRPCLEAQLKLIEHHLRFLLYFRSHGKGTFELKYFCKNTLSSVEAVRVAATSIPKR